MTSRDPGKAKPFTPFSAYDKSVGATRPDAPVQIVKEAKASLLNPSRPFTPGDGGRRLFVENDYADRPSTAALGFRPLGSAGSFSSTQQLPPIAPTSRSHLPPLDRPPSRNDARDPSAAPSIDILTISPSPGSFHESSDLIRPPTAAPMPDLGPRFRRGLTDPSRGAAAPAGSPGLATRSDGAGTSAGADAAKRQGFASFGSLLLAAQQQQQQQPGPAPSSPLAFAAAPPLLPKPTSLKSIDRPTPILPAEPPQAPASAFTAPLPPKPSTSATGSAASSRPGSREDPAAAAASAPPPAPRPPSGAHGARSPSPSAGIGAAPPPPPVEKTPEGVTAGLLVPGAGGSGVILDVPAWAREVSAVLASLSSLGPPQLKEWSQASSHAVALIDLGYRGGGEAWGALLETPASLDGTTIGQAIDRELVRLMESQTPLLALKGASASLRAAGPGAALPAARLLFTISKDSAADAAFRREQALAPMVEALTSFAAARCGYRSKSQGAGAVAGGREPVPLEAAIYLAGALKNVSQDNGNQRALVKLGLLGPLCALITGVTARVGAKGSVAAPPLDTDTSSEDGKVDAWAQLAVQVTAGLRNLSQSASHARILSSRGLAAVPAIARLVELLPGHKELMLNTTRVLSKMVLVEECLSDMASQPALARLLFGLMRDYESHPQILVRSAFVLGLMTAVSADCRAAFRDKPESVCEALAGALHRWASGRHGDGSGGRRGSRGDDDDGAAAAAAASTSSSGKAGASKEKEKDEESSVMIRQEILVKLVRVAANLAIDPVLGPVVASDARVADLLAALLGEFGLTDHEELALNLACAATNLSFYVGPGNVLLSRHAGAVIRAVLPMVVSDNGEAVVEAARTLGNFSRRHEARGEMVRLRAVEALALLLDHADREVVLASAGALVNVASDASGRAAATAAGAAPRLVEALERAGSPPFAVPLPVTSPGGTVSDSGVSLDADLALAACKALYNILSADDGDADAGARLMPSDLASLVGMLSVIPGLEGTPRDLGVVATRLLERVHERGAGVLSLAEGWEEEDEGGEGGVLEPLPGPEGDDGSFLHDE